MRIFKITTQILTRLSANHIKRINDYFEGNKNNNKFNNDKINKIFKHLYVRNFESFT